jgi:cellulose biosynthesis protein BcsQ
MSKQNRASLEKNYMEYLCETVIYYNTQIAQSTAAGMPIFQYNRSSTGAKQIRGLVEEILKLNRMSKKGRKRNKA